MRCDRAALLLTAILISAPATAQEPRETPGRQSAAPSAGRWLRQLANDLDHLQEDLFFERGKYPAGLAAQVEQVSLAVAHLQRVGLRTKDQLHLFKDFQEMDHKVHQLVEALERSGDPWLRRQASRISYSDEQLHYALQRKLEAPRANPRELLARQTHLLEDAARDLEQVDERVNQRDRRLGEAIHEFVERTEHFHEVVEKGADMEHLRGDFQEVDEAWHDVVERLNGSKYGYYLRAAAQNVDRVHNQVHELVIPRQGRVRESATPSDPPPRRRPAIEFEIPGVGRFQIPQ